MHSHVSLLTDYGLDDEFVGVVKSVITDLAPHVRITDITHGIAPFDVRAGSLALARAVQYVPAGIVIAVVDPGVGSSRRAVAVEVAGGRGILLGPDNGLLAPAVAMAGGADRAFELSNTALHLAAPGSTFAGRDVFAPVAAHLCNGLDVVEVGTEIDPALVMPAVVPVASDESHAVHGDGLRCEVTWVDRFGNCQLNVGRDETEHLGGTLKMVFPGGGSRDDVVRVAQVTDHYADIGDGALGIVVDSYGMLSICLDRASAAEMLGAGSGDAVLLFPGRVEPQTASVEIRPAR